MRNLQLLLSTIVVFLFTSAVKSAPIYIELVEPDITGRRSSSPHSLTRIRFDFTDLDSPSATFSQRYNSKIDKRGAKEIKEGTRRTSQVINKVACSCDIDSLSSHDDFWDSPVGHLMRQWTLSNNGDLSLEFEGINSEQDVSQLGKLIQSIGARSTRNFGGKSAVLTPALHISTRASAHLTRNHASDCYGDVSDIFLEFKGAIFKCSGEFYEQGYARIQKELKVWPEEIRSTMKVIG